MVDEAFGEMMGPNRTLHTTSYTGFGLDFHKDKEELGVLGNRKWMVRNMKPRK